MIHLDLHNLYLGNLQEMAVFIFNGISDSYCSLKPLWPGMGEVMPACISPTLHPPSPPTVL